ncbi:MAG TPA: hypothetical protein HA263_06125 [Methanoregulaceae archaeon]|nr:hypothetical protein [Methanoregulaceae archaeon]
MKSTIQSVKAREILDSRGNPTVEVDLTLECGIAARASCPSGASTGIHEAVEMRDRDTGGYAGKGVRKAVNAVNTEIAPMITGLDAANQLAVDQVLCIRDGTPNKARCGANAILAMPIEELEEKRRHFEQAIAEAEQQRRFAQAILVGEQKRLAALLEEHADMLRGRYRARLAAVVDAILVGGGSEADAVEAMAGVVSDEFPAELEATAALMDQELGDRLRVHQENAARLIGSVRVVAAELFEIPYRVPNAEHQFETGSRVWWVRRDWSMTPWSRSLRNWSSGPCPAPRGSGASGNVSGNRPLTRSGRTWRTSAGPRSRPLMRPSDGTQPSSMTGWPTPCRRPARRSQRPWRPEPGTRRGAVPWQPGAIGRLERWSRPQLCCSGSHL